MIVEQFSPVTQRILAIGTALLAVLLAATFVVAPLIDWAAQNVESLNALRERRARLEAIAARGTPPRHDEVPPDQYLAAADSARASEMLRNLVSATAARFGGVAAQVAPVDTPPGDSIVVVSVQASGPPDSLISFASELERGAPRAWLRSWKLAADDSGQQGNLELRVEAAWAPRS